MPVPSKYVAEFYESGIFHVYNRTNNRQLLFKTDENRLYFLRQYAKYLNPAVDTFCWNLLPNHFHFLIRVKLVSEIVKAIAAKPSQPVDILQGIQPSESGIPSTPLQTKTEKQFLKNEINVSKLVEHYFRSFFQSYAMAFNKENNMAGNLFYKPFKRVEVEKDTHFTQAIVYIHANAQKHQLCKDFTEHHWSSWHSIISDKPTLLCRQEVLDWFGGLQPCIDAHNRMTDFYYKSDVGIEDE